MNIDMNELAEALGEGEPIPDPMPDDSAWDEEPEASGETPDDADDSEPSEEEVPPGVDTLTIMGPDGEPVARKLDDILSETLHDIEVDGEVRQVSYDDLRKGYMMQEDYSRKTAEVAQTREELAPYADMVAFAKSDPNFVRYMQAYFVHGGDPVAGMSKYPEVNDDQLALMLASDDPEELARARDIAKDRAERRKAMQANEAKWQKTNEERMEMYRWWSDAQDKRAREVIPDYDNALKGREEYLKGYGFTEQEIESLVDHRLKRVLADALKVRRLEEKSTSPKSELRAKRKQPGPSRSISSGRGKPTDSAQTRSRKAEKRARESGRTEDWADVIGARLGLK